MRFLTSDLPGIGGRLKVEPEDFRVDEIPLWDAAGEGPQVLLRIEKRGLTTHEAAQRLAHAAGVHERDVGFAGIKDSRAVATQWMSAPARCERRLGALRDARLRILETTRHSHKLRIGELQGNRFEIVLRDVADGALPTARAVLAILMRRGVPNWFGAQRFGTKGDSDRIGRALVRGECDEALRLFLGAPSEREQDPRAHGARVHFEQGRLEEAQRSLPPRLRTEAEVLQAYRGHRDPLRALQRIPRRLRLLFLSAYQARLFNRCLDARFDTLDRVLAGDVFVRHATGKPYRALDPTREQERAERFEISPAGPIFGPGLLRASGAAGAIEDAVFERERLDPEESRQVFPDLFLRGDRRAYRFPLAGASVESHPSGIVLRFELPRGCYATNVVAEITKEPAA